MGGLHGAHPREAGSRGPPARRPLGDQDHLRRAVRLWPADEIVFVIDGNRFTTAGGTASIDLMLKIIADDNGERPVQPPWPDQPIIPYDPQLPIRTPRAPLIPTRIGVRHPKLSQVSQMKELNIRRSRSPLDRPATSAKSTPQARTVSLPRPGNSGGPAQAPNYTELCLQKARKSCDADLIMSVTTVSAGLLAFTRPRISEMLRAHYDTTAYRERGVPTATEVAV